MSKVSIQGDQNGTGNFTIAAPNSNTDRTLTLPDEAGSVLTDASDIEPQVKTATNASGDAPVYACRAWVNFDGTNTTIRDSGNVSSITDRGEGRYSVNFNVSMPDSNYSMVGIAQVGAGLGEQHGTVVNMLLSDDFTPSTAEFSVTRNLTGGEGDQLRDSSRVLIQIVR